MAARPQPGSVVTADAPVRTADIRDRFARGWMRALDRYHGLVELLAQGLDPATREAITPGEASLLKGSAAELLTARMHRVIDEAMGAAHAAGASVWGVQQAEPSAAHLAEVQRHKRHATRFALDIAHGVPEQPGRMRIAPRSALYEQAVEGAFHRGVVDGSPPGMLIHWRLGVCRHCIECPVLSNNSPYTKETLPTVPRSGATICKSRCCCNLEFRQATPPAKTPEQQEQDRPLDERIDGYAVRPPPGRRLPTPEEHRVLKDLEWRMNNAVRRADKAAQAGDIAGRDRWLKLRTRLNDRMIEFADGRGVWHVPTWSQAEVLRGADIGMEHIDRLTHLRGIDGTTVRRAQAEAVQQAADAALRDAQRMIAAIPAEQGPAVPDFATLVRLAGAPNVAFTGTFESARPPLTEAVAVGALGRPGDEVVVNVSGFGVAATLRAAVEAVREMSEREWSVVVGPLDEDWVRWVAFAGLWVRGEVNEVRRFIGAVARRVGGRGLEVAQWQA